MSWKWIGWRLPVAPKKFCLATPPPFRNLASRPTPQTAHYFALRSTPNLFLVIPPLFEIEQASEYGDGDLAALVKLVSFCRGQKTS